MTAIERDREERWLRRGMLLLGGLMVALLVLTLASMTVALSNRTASAERAEVTLEELSRIAQRLDGQAQRLEDDAEVSAASRRQFREAAALLLEALEVDDDPFAEVSPPPGMP